MDGFVDNYKKQMNNFIEKSIKNGIISYCQKNDWIKYENNNFIIVDESIKSKIHKCIFSSAIEALDVIKLYLKEHNNNCYSEAENEDWESLSNDAIGE